MTERSSAPHRIAVGVDTGGTFTDFVAVIAGQLRSAKVLSTPDDPARAVLQGLSELGLDSARVDLVHGTTVGTNAVLEGKGARTVFITSTGFADLLSLGRQNRDALYALKQAPVADPVPSALCLEINARAEVGGEVISEPGPDELDQLARRVRELRPEAVAVNLLFGWRHPELEARIRDALPDALPVSLASEVLPEIREYERGIATWLNASIGPLLAGYLTRLTAGLPGGQLAVMQSSGLSISAEQAAERAVHLLLSGPAGGLAAAARIGRDLDGNFGDASGDQRLLSFDMGGTSTDVALLRGRPSLTRDGRIGRYPVAVPMVDLHTIGAGGGSIARVDAGGLIQVGPESAGADPGPACYGRGGLDATVTDANLVLGRLPPGTRLGGRHTLDLDAAQAALTRLGEAVGIDIEAAAQGVIRIANEHMSRALRVMSAERGIDPASAVLMCFGGAGGLHVCELAESLGMTRAVMPARAGVLSALGMLVAEPGRQATASVLDTLDQIDRLRLEAAFAPLQARLCAELGMEGFEAGTLRTTRWVDCRYAGQSATLELAADRPEALEPAFHQAHQQAFGHRLKLPVELVGVRVELRGPARVTHLPTPTATAGKVDRSGPVPVWPRSAMPTEGIVGPAIVIDRDATCWIAPGWRAQRDPNGHLRLENCTPPHPAH